MFTGDMRILRTRPARRRSAGARAARFWGPRGLGELAEEPRDHECDLLADVDCVVADALECARDEDHVHGPLARIGVVADLDGHPEDLPVDSVDLTVLTH